MDEKTAGRTGRYFGVTTPSDSSFPARTKTRNEVMLRSSSIQVGGSLLSTGSFVATGDGRSVAETSACVPAGSGQGSARGELGSSGQSTHPTTAAARGAASRSSTASGDKTGPSLRMGAAISSKNIGFKVCGYPRVDDAAVRGAGH